MSSSLEVV